MDTPRRYDLSIAGLGLRIESDLPIQMPDKFRPFLSEFQMPDLTARFRKTDRLPILSADVLYKDLCYRVHTDGHGGYLRSFFDAPRDLTPYAVSRTDMASGSVLVEYLEKGTHCLLEMNSLFFHIGLESALLSRDRLILHASCIQTELGGILFSGPSGIGKSTQAELWCSNQGAEQLNGDRPILSKERDGWLAWGSPYAGSSNCYVNKNCPVTAIVILRQAKECTLRRLSAVDAFRAVWSGLTMNSWDRVQADRASALTLELIRSVPVYMLACTPDARAVELLNDVLREECL